MHIPCIYLWDTIFPLLLIMTRIFVHPRTKLWKSEIPVFMFRDPPKRPGVSVRIKSMREGVSLKHVGPSIIQLIPKTSIKLFKSTFCLFKLMLPSPRKYIDLNTELNIVHTFSKHSTRKIALTFRG